MRISKVEHAFAKAPNFGFLLVGKDGSVKFINKKFEQIFALPSKKYYYAEFDEFVKEISEFDGKISFEKLKNSPLNTHDFVIEKSGRYFRLNVSNVLEGGKNFDGFMLTISDMTYEKELEIKDMEHERLLALNAKMAVVGEMINSISHQQRQPLSSILLSLGNIEECVESGDISLIHKHIAHCKNGINLMNETISAFRSFYKQDEKTSVFDLKDIVKELIFIAKPQMNTNGITLGFNCEDGEFVIHSVASYVKQILLSLLSNSKDELARLIREDADIDPKILINLQKINGEFCISVSDNGSGIDVSADEIFKPFYTTKKDIGTGMGLYVAKILAQDRLGARLVLESAKNPTKFSLFLRPEL